MSVCLRMYLTYLEFCDIHIVFNSIDLPGFCLQTNLVYVSTLLSRIYRGGRDIFTYLYYFANDQYRILYLYYIYQAARSCGDFHYYIGELVRWFSFPPFVDCWRAIFLVLVSCSWFPGFQL